MQENDILEKNCNAYEEEKRGVIFLITFPSMESFLGQCSDIIMYTSNFKVSYDPFLGKCIKSFDNLNTVFTELFPVGNVKNALSTIDLSHDKHSYLLRYSPIMKHWTPVMGNLIARTK